MSPILIPHSLFQRAVSLEPLGLDEQVWRLRHALEVIDLLENSPVAALGGDVYVKTNAGFENNYEPRLFAMPCAKGV